MTRFTASHCMEMEAPYYSTHERLDGVTTQTWLSNTTSSLPRLHMPGLHSETSGLSILHAELTDQTFKRDRSYEFPIPRVPIIKKCNMKIHF